MKKKTKDSRLEPVNCPDVNKQQKQMSSTVRIAGGLKNLSGEQLTSIIGEEAKATASGALREPNDRRRGRHDEAPRESYYKRARNITRRDYNRAAFSPR